MLISIYLTKDPVKIFKTVLHLCGGVSVYLIVVILTRFYTVYSQRVAKLILLFCYY